MIEAGDVTIVDWHAYAISVQEEIQKRFLPRCSPTEKHLVTRHLIPMVNFARTTTRLSNHSLGKSKISSKYPELLRWGLVCFVFGTRIGYRLHRIGDFLKETPGALDRFKLGAEPCLPLPREVRVKSEPGLKRKAGNDHDNNGDNNNDKNDVDEANDEDGRIFQLSPVKKTKTLPSNDHQVASSSSEMQPQPQDLQKEDDVSTCNQPNSVSDDLANRQKLCDKIVLDMNTARVLFNQALSNLPANENRDKLKRDFRDAVDNATDEINRTFYNI